MFFLINRIEYGLKERYTLLQFASQDITGLFVFLLASL